MLRRLEYSMQGWASLPGMELAMVPTLDKAEGRMLDYVDIRFFILLGNILSYIL